MILLLFFYDPLYASSHDLESDYPLSGLKEENSPIPELYGFNLFIGKQSHFHQQPPVTKTTYVCSAVCSLHVTYWNFNHLEILFHCTED